MSASGGRVTVELTLDTTQFDKQMRRLKRRTRWIRLTRSRWLFNYACFVTGYAITFTVFMVTR